MDIFYTIKVNNFNPIDEFVKLVDGRIYIICNAKRADGVDRIDLPGEIEWLNQRIVQQ